MECPTGMVYTETAPACPATCGGPNPFETQCDTRDQGEGCICEDENRVVIGNRCVHRDRCGCVDGDGNLHEVHMSCLYILNMKITINIIFAEVCLNIY